MSNKIEILYIGNKKTVSILGILLILSLIYFYRSIIIGEVLSPAGMIYDYYPWVNHPHDKFTTQPIRSDDVFLVYPQLDFLFKNIKSGVLPLFNKNVLAGNQEYLHFGWLLHPVNLIFYLLPVSSALGIVALLKILLAGFFMFLYLNESGCNRYASFFGAIVFAYNGFQIVWLSSVIGMVWMWLPLAFFAIEKLIKNPVPKYIVLFAFSQFSQLMSSYLPLSIIFLFLTCSYFLFRYLQEFIFTDSLKRENYLKIQVYFAVATAAGILLSAFALFPAVLTFIGTKTAARTAGLARYPLLQLLTFLIPDFFGNAKSFTFVMNYCEVVSYCGILPAILFLLSFFLLWKKRIAIFHLVFALITIGYLYGLKPFSYLGYLPGFRQIATMRWSGVLIFSIAVLSAMMVDYITADRITGRMKNIIFRLICGIAIILFCFVVLNKGAFNGKLFYTDNRILTFIIFLILSVAGAFLAGKKDKPVLKYIFVLIPVFDLFKWGIGFNPTIKKKDFFPETKGLEYIKRNASRSRTICLGSFAVIMPGNIPGIFNIENIGGYDMGTEDRYIKYLSATAGVLVKPVTETNFINLVNINGSSSWNVLNLHVELKSPLIDMLNVKYIATPPGAGLDHIAGETQIFHNIPAGEILSGRTVGQSFYSGMENLSRVDVLMATYGRKNTSDLFFMLQDMESEKVLYTRGLKPEEIRDNDWLCISFPPIKSSKGKKISFTFKSMNGTESNAFTIWMNKDNVYPNGERLVNGSIVAGDLCFKTYYGISHANKLKKVYAGEIEIYENTEVYPYAWGVYKVISEKDDIAALKLLKSGDINFRETVTLDADIKDPMQNDVKQKIAKVQVTSFENNRVTIKATMEDDGFIIVSEKYHPNWKIKVNEKNSIIYRANYLFMAIPVKKGDNELLLYISNRYLNIGLIVSISVLVLLCAFVIKKSPKTNLLRTI